jgi:hypothetical protein
MESKSTYTHFAVGRHDAARIIAELSAALIHPEPIRLSLCDFTSSTGQVLVEINRNSSGMITKETE